jgi:transcriptional regulator with PAS, ATPase and Fis domain
MCDGKEIQSSDISYHQVGGDDFFTSSEKTLKVYIADIISYYLKKHNQNVVLVAEKLDIGKSTIYNMLKSGEITLNK